MTDSERLAEVRRIITGWNFGAHGTDMKTLVAIWHVVGDNIQPRIGLPNLQSTSQMASETAENMVGDDGLEPPTSSV